MKYLIVGLILYYFYRINFQKVIDNKSTSNNSNKTKEMEYTEYEEVE